MQNNIISIYYLQKSCKIRQFFSNQNRQTSNPWFLPQFSIHPALQPSHSDKTKHTNQQAELIFLIDDIYRGSTRQQPVKDPKQDTARYFLHFPEHQTLLFTTRTLNLMIFSLLSMASHPLFHSLKALLGLLRHTFFSCKLVAPQIHLPAGDTVHHFWMAMQAMTSYPADRFYELGIRFRPLVEVHIIRSDRHPWVSRIMDTVWYANRAHFTRGFGALIRISDWLYIDLAYRDSIEQKKRYTERQRQRERSGRSIANGIWLWWESGDFINTSGNECVLGDRFAIEGGQESLWCSRGRLISYNDSNTPAKRDICACIE